MSGIKLDPRKLLGFKIIAEDGSTVRLTSPKIGDKGCFTMSEDGVPGISQVVGSGALSKSV